MSLIVRDATLEDAEDILAIYNYAAINTTAVWTDGPADLDSRREWMRARQAAGYPVLVAMKGRDVVGFASFGDFRPGPAIATPWRIRSMSASNIIGSASAAA